MSESSNKIERIENEKLVELLGRIREDNSEENMIAVLKEAAAANFLVPVDGSDGIIEWGVMGTPADGQMLLHLSGGNEVTGIHDVDRLCGGCIDIIGNVVAVTRVCSSAPTEIIPMDGTFYLYRWSSGRWLIRHHRRHDGWVCVEVADKVIESLGIVCQETAAEIAMSQS